MGKRGSRTRFFRADTSPARRGRSPMSTQLRKIAAKAKQDPKARLTSLAHLLTPAFLRGTWRHVNLKSARGSDRQTIQRVETKLRERISDFWQGVRASQYHMR